MIDRESEKVENQIQKSDLISRDLSWLGFNERVLDQAKNENRSLVDRLKFLAITASNFDEFFMVRVGSLYNYLDYGKSRTDYSGLDEYTFKKKLFHEVRRFVEGQNAVFSELSDLMFQDAGFRIERDLSRLEASERKELKNYFKETVFPMLTPMAFDSYHTFPVLLNKILIFGVVTEDQSGNENSNKLSLVQIPKNLSRFYELRREDCAVFVPIESVIREYIHKLFRNVPIMSVSLFRITRNGDFTLEESEDIETNFLEELKSKLKSRKTGRVVRVETEEGADVWMLDLLKGKLEIDDDNIFTVSDAGLIDFTSLWQIVKHPEYRHLANPLREPVKSLSLPDDQDRDILELLKTKDVLVHSPYHSYEIFLDLLERACEDPKVLSIKMTIYRLADNSRVTAALLRALENGKHVSVLFEVKARFDEENNLREAKRLQNAGCFVIYGMSHLKTHTKLLLIVRKDSAKRITRYVHMASGNFNEDTAKLYTDLALMSTNEVYARDVAEFFNVITGHSDPSYYENLITAPRDMRNQLLDLIGVEIENAKNGKKAGVVIKLNSLQDKDVIAKLYEASNAGVQIRLIVRGICCLRPGREGLSENIKVRSIVGDYLEHSRIYYFHNGGSPKVYCGSADVMVRSFDRRLESLFLVLDDKVRAEMMCVLDYNLKDNVNAYQMLEDGAFRKIQVEEGEEEFNLHEQMYNLTKKELKTIKLF
ncbi:polyphosphate kinase [Fulvitalea axinellae]|uniref:Polyphosphate kinase n=2 Tax=Fulvitalea axinellae TaxID=1182444 RepID=A0AAU9D832_9BACT|nr:polyphosphate kinase [Fulvitalea axinellae]